MKIVKYIVLSLVLIASLVGLFFAVRFALRLKAAIIYTQQREAMVEAFIIKNFPEQVDAYNAQNKQPK